MANLPAFPWTNQFIELQINSVFIATNNISAIVSCGMAGRCGGSWLNGAGPNVTGYYCKLAGSGAGTGFGGSGTIDSGNGNWETGIYGVSGGNMARTALASGSISGTFFRHYRFEITGFRPVTLALKIVNADGTYTTINSTTHDFGALLSIASGNPGLDGGSASDGNGGSIPNSTVNYTLVNIGTL